MTDQQRRLFEKGSKWRRHVTIILMNRKNSLYLHNQLHIEVPLTRWRCWQSQCIKQKNQQSLFEFLKLNLPLPFIHLCLWTFSFPMCVCGKLLSITVRLQAVILWKTIITPQQYWMRMYLDFLLLDPFLRLFQQPKYNIHLQRWSNPI